MHIVRLFSRPTLITLMVLTFGWVFLAKILGGTADDWVGFLLVALSALCLVAAFLILISSILFAPVAGLIFYQYAKGKDGLNCLRYAAVGSASSALLIAPFVFVKSRMAGNTTSVEDIKQNYRLLHELWACLVVSNTAIVYLIYDFACCSLSPTIPTAITLAVGVPALVASMSFVSKHRFNQEDFELGEDVLPGFRYSLPFLGATVNILIVPIAIMVSL